MRRRTWAFVLAGLVLALVLAFGVSRYASSQPDGLEKVAADTSMGASETDHASGGGPFAGYATTGIDDPGLATGVAGVVGVLVTFAVAGALVGVAVRVGRRRAAAEPS
jgi:hypothetical protein